MNDDTQSKTNVRSMMMSKKVWFSTKATHTTVHNTQHNAVDAVNVADTDPILVLWFCVVCVKKYAKIMRCVRRVERETERNR